MEQSRAVWVAEVVNRGTLVRLIRVALDRGVAPVDLREDQLAGGPHVLQLRLDGLPLVVLAAELAGETASGAFALRLGPLDPSHVPELTLLAERGDDDAFGALSGPMSTSSRELFGRQTLADPEPEMVDDDELQASVLFDPEAALISRAPARPDGTETEDTLTIPARASMMPAQVPPPRAHARDARPAGGPQTISHFSFPSMAPSTERLEGADDAPPERSVSVVVDFESSQSNVHTQRWEGDDGSAANDPSIGMSVVFDPDVLAREQRRPSVDFEDLSLTPTAPMDVPPPRPTFVRENHRTEPRAHIDFDQIVTEDDQTFPRDDSRRMPSQRLSGGPRTIGREGTHGLMIVGRVIANRYRIDSLLGSGAVGAVYKATHVDLPRTFAIKVLHPHYRADPQLMASLRAEARAASLLDHPNVTAVQDFGEEPDGIVYIVMEYLAGVNLQVVLDDVRRMHPQRAIGIMLQVCSALTAAHERGIVHRDVKPDNIMLVPSRDDEGNPFEMVKVCDFGIAALDSPAAHAASAAQWTAGTPEYMAPEQAHGRAEPRSDVYACGVVLYEMLTGRPPFVGETTAATLAKHANELPRRPSDLVPGLTPALDTVILRALEKAPALRFATMRELRAELKRLL